MDKQKGEDQKDKQKGEEKDKQKGEKKDKQKEEEKDEQKGKELDKVGTMTMKLLIDKSKNKVLFAEAEKECVDFIFSVLAMPVGALVRYLNKDSMDGSLGNVHDSLKNLRCEYMQHNVSKDSLLKPKPAAAACSQLPLLILSRSPSARKAKGFVKGAVTYMITDDLVVKPFSTISTVSFLNKFNVKDMANLEERVVNLDWNEGLALVFHSLASRTVLTDVYIGKRRRRDLQEDQHRFIGVVNSFCA